MSEHALDDPAVALRRVLARLPSAPDRRQWPDPAEILNALRQYWRCSVARAADAAGTTTGSGRACASSPHSAQAGGRRAGRHRRCQLAGATAPAATMAKRCCCFCRNRASRTAWVSAASIVHAGGCVAACDVQADELDFELWLLPLRDGARRHWKPMAAPRCTAPR